MQKNEIAKAVGSIDTERDWVDDSRHENGRYQCRCIDCNHLFVGHKRRVLCKKCHEFNRDAFRPIGGRDQ